MTSSGVGGAGRRLGRYHLSDPLGGGPTGEVFRAKVYGVAGFERQFAVKRFHPEFVKDPGIASRVATAARMYGSLEHPRIARLHEYGVSGGETFTATELVTGIDLARLIAITGDQPLVVGAAISLVSQIARAIGYAHGRGISHLGICPTNLICNLDGEVKVTDFGFLPPRLPVRPANDYSLKARIPYLTPEQLANEPTSAATDVFQLGVVACELVTGKHCFAGPTPFEIGQEILSGKPPELNLPKPLVKVLYRCLARSPFERFPDAGALADALDAATRSSPLPGDRRDVSSAVRQALERLAEMSEQQVSGALHFPLPAPPLVAGQPAAGPPAASTAPPPPPPPARPPAPPSVPPSATPATPPGRSVTPLAKLLQGAAQAGGDASSDVEEATIPRRTLLGVVAQTPPDTGEEDAPTQVRERAGVAPDEFAVPGGDLPAPPPLTGPPAASSAPPPPPLMTGEISKPEAVAPAPSASVPAPVPVPAEPGSGPVADASAVVDTEGEEARSEPPIPPPFPIAQLPPEALDRARPGARKVRTGLWLVLGLVVVFAGGFVLYDQVLSKSGSSASGPERTAEAVAPTDAGTRVAVAPPGDAGSAVTPPHTDAGAGAPIARVAPPDATPAATGPDLEPGEEPDSDGQLVIESVPKGAKVYLDGAPKGETPVTVEGVSDKQSLALIKAGYKLYVAEIDGRGQVAVTLEEVTPPGGPAGIKVRCHKKNRYYVFVDDYDTGQLCPTERIGVDIGQHEVEIYDPITEQRHSFRATVKQTRNSLRVHVD